MKREYLRPLDGLRFLAALFVMLAHYSATVLVPLGVDAASTTIAGLVSVAGIGMALFFCLSGFVIHYNYGEICGKPGGTRSFLIARFARLYPLYIVLLIYELYLQYRNMRGACSPNPAAMLLALPYYLTLTQSWFYAVICKNSLSYQYHMVAAISWSISVEFFLYLVYCGIGHRVKSIKSAGIQIALAVAVYASMLLYFAFLTNHTSEINAVAKLTYGEIATSEYGYQDSLLRWLYYFNPVVNCVPFLMGVIAANVFMQKGSPRRSGSGLLVVAIGLLIGVHVWIYLFSAPYIPVAGRLGSFLYVPLVALIIYLAVVCRAGWIGKALSNSLMVKLGESSYSIYLLHAFFAFDARDNSFAGPWVMYGFAVVAVLLISRLSYLWFERPMQLLVRRMTRLPAIGEFPRTPSPINVVA